MDKWEEHVKLEITDAAIADPVRLAQITVAISEMQAIDLIPDETHSNLNNLINKVNNATDH